MSIQLCVTNFHSSPLVSPSTLTNTCSNNFTSPKRAPAVVMLQQHFQNLTSNSTLPPVGQSMPDNYANWVPISDPSQRRRSGILLHPTSFQSPYCIGDLGEQAFRFLDWLHQAGCSLWQVLPLVPPGRRANEEGSPYSGQVTSPFSFSDCLGSRFSSTLFMLTCFRKLLTSFITMFCFFLDANCGNTLLISLEELVKDGLLTHDELPKPLEMDRVNYSVVADIKDPLIAKAAERLTLSNGELKTQLEDFRKDPNIGSWLEDAAIFAAIDDSFKTMSWYDWPEPLKNRHLAALEEIYQSRKDYINIFIAQQFLFQRQWQKVRDYARGKGISIMGDMPIYVGYHSADVWANKKSFSLNKKGFPILVSGVPPDAFSETGQLWGSPLYDWKAMEKDGFSWWIHRLRRAQDLFDEFRIDHFRGFSGYWAVPSEAKIATVGKWKVGPGKSLFDAIFKDIGEINIVAEDLGVITEDVVQLRKSIGAPGMAVLQFGFGSDAGNPHLPHNHEHNQVVYTGTHDNDTVRGWWDLLQQEEKSSVLRYLSISEEDDISWALIQAAFASVARTSIIPMQDVLGLGSSARMNTPATQFGNWGWRMPATKSFDKMSNEAKKLRDLLSTYGRL